MSSPDPGDVIGCGIGIATVETVVGGIVAGATCGTAVGLTVVGDRTGSSTMAGAVGTSYGCISGLAFGFVTRNLEDALSGAIGCVTGAGLDTASERSCTQPEVSQPPGSDAAPPDEPTPVPTGVGSS